MYSANHTHGFFSAPQTDLSSHARSLTSEEINRPAMNQALQNPRFIQTFEIISFINIFLSFLQQWSLLLSTICIKKKKKKALEIDAQIFQSNIFFFILIPQNQPWYWLISSFFLPNLFIYSYSLIFKIMTPTSKFTILSLLWA